MFSVGEAAKILGWPEHKVRYVIGTRDLGRKVGWAIVLSDSDIDEMRSPKGPNNGKQDKQAA